MTESVTTAAVTNPANEWERIKTILARKISPQSYQNWVVRTSFEGFDSGVVRVSVPDQVTKEFMEQEYAEEVRSAARELNLHIECVRYIPKPAHFSAPAESAEPIFGSAVSHINPRFDFKNFVVGSCNQFAHAAAKAVAHTPSRSYNPLFLYGGVGVGKTHLMHAIGRELLERYPAMRIVYTSSERFMNEMITCVKSERMPAFHRHYRSADVLLVDDIQVLAGKERTQEEFFHTFNELYDHQKQIVISSDSAPKSTPGLVERLRSRFEWGLMVDIQPPDLETKMAILDKKAEQEGVHLPEDVRNYIATKTKSNVRELEGALLKLVAYSEVTGSAITLPMAQQVLKYLIPTGEKRITMDAVLRAVAEKFQLQPAMLKQKTNARHIAYPRQVAMYLIKELTQSSLPEIGRMFGGKHHTTVLHSVQKIDRLRREDAEVNRLIHSVIDSIH
ncbi:MAG TPA: chromosomal replication initiator protein DnaA [Bryobacteraceae bacterium]|jgi:chromosomal replication initiator protein|nr:chromosomal replication initiator protein DnaA [Bryobacteraceae bacterium]